METVPENSLQGILGDKGIFDQKSFKYCEVEVYKAHRQG